MIHCPHNLTYRPRSEYTLDQCRVCWLGLTPNAERGTRNAERKPCLYVRETSPAPPPPGKSVRQAWIRCEVIGEVVCRCACNAQCRGYEADSEENA
jgi:hypothetical protein